ncbi:MAG: hypothetical protein DMD91_32035, partial [Candidatus Rokuibacteriota bacterium]
DIWPVFDAVLDRALTLCEASDGSLYQLEDGALRHVGARGIESRSVSEKCLDAERCPGAEDARLNNDFPRRTRRSLL